MKTGVLTAVRSSLVAAGAIIGAACTHPVPRAITPADYPRTRPELTRYQETSRYADVRQFLDSLRALRAPLVFGSIGKTNEGRDIPYVIASRPTVATPVAARSLGRPIVYVQANIHAGEVEGKDALLALLRDLVFSPGPDALDSIVLIAVPIYNADGNERFASQSINRTEQNGPELVGVRANAQNLDLNRDYVKAEAPETRASLAMFNTWDPDVFVDLHTTDGSFHGYALTYSPSLSPAAVFGGFYARDSLLPILRQRMRTRDGFEIFDYGNFVSDERGLVADTSLREGWATYDSRPRFGTNYYGIRGRIGILSEAYSHDSLARRIASTYAFVKEILSLVGEKGEAIRSLSARADTQPLAGGRSPDSLQMVAVRSELIATPPKLDVIKEDLVKTGDSSLTQPGVPRGERRSGIFKTVRMPVYDRFTSTLDRLPPAAYVIAPQDTAAVTLLRRHGIRIDRSDSAWTARGETFTIDSIITAPRLFQGHHEVRLRGTWQRGLQALPPRSFIVSTAQPRGALIVYLLEPESEDGLTTWNFFDAELRKGGRYPVTRIFDLSRRGRAATRRSSSSALQQPQY
ncbi:MAG TPA: M14 family zinc carboxypeptidase [Gemmatimonadaceae bacterium]|nr:M14 family zinc carboxypeptidase [Gemmatimonadaceae bacterium]